MFKNIKLLSILTAMILPSSLVLISCSSTPIKTKSEIKINEVELLKNFNGGDLNTNTFTEESISSFVDKFNQNPKHYIVGQELVTDSFPFLEANYDHFKIKDKTENQFDLKVEKGPGPSSTFKSMKFYFGLKSEYEPTISIKAGSIIQNEINSNIASIILRILLPDQTNNSKEWDDEIKWIEGFFSSDKNIYFKNKEIEDEILSLKPSQVIAKITNKTQFNDYFKFNAQFPSFLLTGWNFAVDVGENTGEIVDTSVKLIFSLSNIYLNPIASLISKKEIILGNLIPENKE